MFRSALNYLEQKWITSTDRKPLVIRGARQVGKTWLVRKLAEKKNLKLIEINFERDPQIKSLFNTNNPKIIIQNLEVYFGTTINSSYAILFLDEIQDAPEIIAKLRWFYEELPELPVIAAGSLLEFILQDHSFSMPVGRITYLHIEPLSFEEFLDAHNEERLLNYIQTLTQPFLIDKIPAAIHQKITDYFRMYIQVGGMPAVVSTYITQGINQSMRTQEDLLATYRDDFFKYKGRIDVQKLDIILKSIPFQLGEKFVYSKTDASIQSITAKQILSLFNKARLSHVVKHSAGNRSPLAAESKDKSFKQIFLDVGLVNRMLGSLSFQSIAGGVAEQVVGQMLRCLTPFYMEPTLYYWNREEKGSSAEIDYLIEYKNQIIPIEVKAGSTGSLKSLHLFMSLRNLQLAIRINEDKPSITNVQVNQKDGTSCTYKLLSIPFYLIGQLHRFLDECILPSSCEGLMCT